MVVLIFSSLQFWEQLTIHDLYKFRTQILVVKVSFMEVGKIEDREKMQRVKLNLINLSRFKLTTMRVIYSGRFIIYSTSQKHYALIKKWSMVSVRL